MASSPYPVSELKTAWPHSFPVSQVVLELLKRRRQTQADNEKTLVEFVFPSPSAQHRFYWTTTSPLTSRVARTANIEALTMHSLRRTFATHAFALVPYLHCKRLLNHVTTAVTAGHYIVLTLEALRESVEKVNAFLLTEMGIPKNATADSITTASPTYKELNPRR